MDGARSYAAEGYGAVKLRIGVRRAEEDVARVRAVREAVGDTVRLMVDCNERLDLPTAQWLARQLAELDVYWMEEPFRSEDVAGHATLAQRSGLPVAVGEHLQGRFEFAVYLEQRAASVLQPDVPLTGGVTEWLRISAVAEIFGAVLSPHFLPELHVHIKEQVLVDLDRPRGPDTMNSRRFHELTDQVWEILRVESEKVLTAEGRPGT